MKIMFGSGNQHKLFEIRKILGNNYEVTAPDPSIPEPEETGETLEENALLKARYYFEQEGIPCFADDTGLEVDALNGAPGVHTARFAGEDASYEDNYRKLLNVMQTNEDRTARFRTVVCFFDGNDSWLFSGELNGMITKDPRGDKGFGYDPVFVPEGYDRTLAEMDAEEKNRISHRGLAMEKFREWLDAK